MNKSTRYFSDQQEKAVAKTIGGKKVANSGATAFNKGDVILGNWLIECKTSLSAKSSFSIKKKWLEKNKTEAFAMGKEHNALCFEYEPAGACYYIVSEKDFIQMQQALDREEENAKKW